MSDKIAISIIMPVKNGNKLIKETLSCIFSQKIDCDFEVIIIDSGSTDGTLEIIKQFPKVKLFQIKPSEFGHGKTRNLGVKKSIGEYLVFINQDAEPANEYWLKNLIEPFSFDSKVAGVYSRHLPRQWAYLYIERMILSGFSNHKIITTRDDIERALSDKSDVFRKKLNEITRFSTVSAAIRRDVFEKIPFDNDIPVAEDQDWAKKVLMAGYKIVYEPASMVYHSHNARLKELFTWTDVSVDVYDKVLERKKRNVLYAILLFIGGTLFDAVGDAVYIFAKDIPISKKIREIFIACSSRIVINLSKAISVFVMRVHSKIEGVDEK